VEVGRLSPFLLGLDGLTAQHLAVALARHQLACSRDGIEVPPLLVELFAACQPLSRPSAATGGHLVAASAAIVEHPPMDYVSAADALGVSVRTVGRWVASGRLVRVGRKVTPATVAAAVSGRAAA
jgi:hypothetical protein